MRHVRSAAAILLLVSLAPMAAGGQGPRFGWPWPSRLTRSADALGSSQFLLSGPGAIRPAAAERTAQEPAAQNPAFLGGDTVPDIVVGTGRGDGFVRVLSGVDGREIISGRPFGPTFNGGVRVAAGDVNADGVPDVIVGQGLGGAQVRIFSGANGADIASFTAFASFTGGVYVAGGDVNGDGHADVIVGAGAGGGVVRVFSGVDRREIASGYPFGPAFAGGVSVAVGDVNGDGQLDYVTGMALGGWVRVFDGATLGVLAQGFPFGPFYFGGVAVAAGDMNGDGRSEVTVGAQLDIRPPVRVYDIVTGGLHASFPPHPLSLGANVAAGDLNGDGYWELLTGAGMGGPPEVRVFNGQTHAEMLRGLVFPPGFSGGVYLTTTASGLPNLRFTSPTTATFTAGTAGSFTITTSGAINPQIRLVGGTLPTGLTFTDNGNGTATIAGTAGAGTGGVYTLQFRGGFGVGIPYTLTLTVREAPSITSPNATFMVANAPASFTVTTTGYPARTLSVSGVLPPGVSFVDNGNSTATLAGTPALGSSGVYPLIITAANGVTPDATQNFTLTVHNPPSITSVATATFTAGVANSFLVTTSAFPTATVITGTGALPGGVTFTNNGDGTATLSGNPATGTAGDYALQLSASNGIGSPATQNFTLTVIPNPTPIFTSAASTVFTVNTGGSFTVTTSAFPAVNSIARVGALPPGVTYTDNGNGTATLAGMPQLGSDGAYPLQFTADNGAATATQNFTLTVNPPAGGLPVITSANGATFVVGAAGTFLVTTTATPAVTTIVATGALPGGVTFTNNADGTATLSGTAAAGTAGIYPLTIDATNTNGTASQAFTLTVNNETSVPVFTSATSTTFTIGTAGTFQITTAANPDVTTITLTGTPPTGVNFLDNGNGTATLSGTPTAGAGLNSLIFSASNGIGAPVTQNFSLNVQQPAAVTSATSTNFDAGIAGTFTVTTVGTPVPSLGFTGSLPSGVNFVDQGNGTAVISGLAPIGTASPYPITITATNGVGVPGTQSFTLNVIGNNPPTLDPIASPAPIDEDAAQQTVNLTGISAGFNETQTLQVTATSSDTGVVPNPAVTYTSPAATGSLAYTPVPGASGTATITVTVTDTGLNGVFGGGDDGTVTQTFLVTVNAVLDPPTLDAIANASIPEDSATQTVNLTGISAGVGETQDLQVTATSNNTGLIPNPAVTYTSPNATGTLDYTPVVNQSGSADITVTVTDAGPDLSLATPGDNGVFTRTFTVTVGGVNDPPVAVGDGYGVAEGGTLNVAAPGVLVNDTDIDGPGLNAVLVTGPSNASSFTLNADGSFSYTHNGSETTTDSFTYRANDTLADSNIVTVTITITPVNDGPVIDLDQDDSGTTAGNYAATFTEGDPSPVLLADTDATITDAEQTTLDSLTVTITNLLDAGFETLSANTTGTSLVASYDTGTPGIGVLTISGAAQPIADYITVLKTVGYSNTDENPDATQRTVTFVGHDGIGTGPAATTLVTVTPVNDPPTADDENFSLTPGGTLTIPAPGVLAGDTDPEGATLTAVNFSSPADAVTFTANPDGSFTYQHNGIGTADVTFTYQANDGAGVNNLSNVATVTIDINSPPVATDDSYNTDEETTLTVPAGTGVLSNDSAGDAGDTVTVAAVNGSGANVGVPITTGQGALLTLNADGSFFYDPTGVAAFQQLGAGQSLIDSVTYTAQDLGGLQDIGTLTITVDGVNDAPVLTASAGDTAFTEDGGAVAVDGGITLTDTDTVPIASATVTISNLLNAGLETLALGSAPPAGVTANYVAPTLTISGNATVAEYQTMLRSVTYNNTSQSPNTTARTINFQVNDGTVNSGVAGKTVTVASVNDAPIVAGAGNTLAYTEGNAATAIEAALAIADADHTQLTGATVQISANFAAGQDVLSFTPVGLITGIVAGNTLTLSGTDTLANYELALESVKYFNSSVAPSELPRTVTWIVTDGTTPSTPVFSTITVTAVNSAPNGGPDTWETFGNTELRVGLAAVATPHVLDASAPTSVLANDSDPEGDAVALVSLVGGCALGTPCATAGGGIVVLNADGTFSYTPDDGDTVSDSFAYVLTDIPAAGAPVQVNVTVTLTLHERIWYVDGDVAGPGTGTSTDPFSALPATVGDADDYVFVHDAAVPLTGAITLQTGQKLYGAATGLSINQALNGNAAPAVLVAPGGTATINATGGDAVKVLANTVNGNLTGVEIRGLTLSTSFAGSNAIDVTSADAANVAVTISDVIVTGATAEGIDINHGSTGTGTLSVSNVTVTSAGAGIDVNESAAGALTVTGFSNLTVNAGGGGGGVIVTNATFDSTPGGGYNTLDGGTSAIGGSGTPVGAAGLTLTNVTGDITFDELDIHATTTGLLMTGTGAVDGATGTGTRVAVTSGSVFASTSGPVVNVTNATVNLPLDSLSSGGGATAVSLVNVNDGTGGQAAAFSAAAGSISGATTTAFSVNGSNASITYDGDITHAGSGAAVSVAAHTDSATFTGTLTVTGGTGLQFDNADGTYAFSGTTSLNGGDAGIDILNGSTGTFTFGSGTAITNPTGDAFDLSSSNATVTYSGSITDNTGFAVDIDNHDSGTVTFQTGAITSTGTGLRVANSNGGTINFNSPTIALTTTTNKAVTLDPLNSGKTINFGPTGGAGLDIITTTGTGFSALGGGTISVTGGGNSISSSGGTAVDMADVVIAAGGFTFGSTSSNGGTHGVRLDSITGGAIDLGTGALGNGSTTATFMVGDGGASAGAGGTSAISYSGTIAAQGLAHTVNIQDRAASAGAITLSGNLTHTGDGTAVLLDDNAAGTITFSGTSKALSSGTATAVSLTDNGGATIAFTGGGLDIDTTSGAGFVATGGGTVTVTGTVNTLTATGLGAANTALRVASTTIGAGGMTWQSIASTGGTKGISLDTTGTGTFTVSGTGAAGSGGTIQTASLRGAEFISASNISLTHMNLTGNGTSVLSPNAACADGLNASISATNTAANCQSNLHLQTVSAVTLNSLTVTNSKQNGINGHDVTNLTLTTLTVTGNGDEAFEDGVQLANLKGTNVITGGIYRDNAARSLEVQNNAAGATTLTVTGGTYGNTLNPTGGTTPSTATAADTILVATNGANAASLTTVIKGATFSNIFGRALNSNTEGNTTQNVTFGQAGAGNGNTVSNVSYGTDINGTTSGAVTYSIMNNVFTNTAGSVTLNSRTVINSRKGFGATGTWIGTISSNVIGTAAVAQSGCDAVTCGGISADNAGVSGTHDIVITNNTIRRVNGHGIFVANNPGAATTGTVRARIEGNTMTDPDDGTTGAGGNQGSGVFVSTSGTGAILNVKAGGAGGLANNVTGNWNTAGAGTIRGVRVSRGSNSTFCVNGYVGAGDSATVGTFITTQNTGNAGSATQSLADGLFFTGGACSVP